MAEKIYRKGKAGIRR